MTRRSQTPRQTHQLNVVQGVHDTYINPERPGSDQGQKLQVAQALARLSPSLTNALSVERSSQRLSAEEDRIAGQEAYEGSRKAWTEAIKAGDIEDYESPYFREGYERSYAATLSHDFEVQARDAFLQDSLSQVDDPSAGNAFFEEMSQSFLQASDHPEFKRVFNHNRQAALARLDEWNTRRVGERVRAKAYEQYQMRTDDILDEWDGESYDGLAASLSLYKDDQRAGGIDGTFANQALIERVAQEAVSRGDADMFNEVLSRVQGGTGPLIKTTAARDIADRVTVQAETVAQREALQEEIGRYAALLIDINRGLASPDDIQEFSEDYNNLFSADWTAQNIARSARNAMSGTGQANIEGMLEAAAMRQAVADIALRAASYTRDEDGNIVSGVAAEALPETFSAIVSDDSGNEFAVELDTEEVVDAFLSENDRQLREQFSPDSPQYMDGTFRAHMAVGRVPEQWKRVAKAASNTANGRTLTEAFRPTEGDDELVLNASFEQGLKLAEFLYQHDATETLDEVFGEDSMIWNTAVEALQSGIVEGRREAVLFAGRRVHDRKVRAEVSQRLDENTAHLDKLAKKFSSGPLDETWGWGFDGFEDYDSLNTWVHERYARHLMTGATPAQAYDRTLNDGNRSLINMGGYLMDTSGLPDVPYKNEAFDRVRVSVAEQLEREPGDIILLPDPLVDSRWVAADRETHLPIDRDSPLAVVDSLTIAAAGNAIKSEKEADVSRAIRDPRSTPGSRARAENRRRRRRERNN
jgi:hypothetical protein